MEDLRLRHERPRRFRPDGVGVAAHGLGGADRLGGAVRPAKEPRAGPHRLGEAAPQRVGRLERLRTIAGGEPCERLAGRGTGIGRPADSRRVARGRGAGARPEDHGIGKGVVAEPVGAVHAARRLAGRVEPGQGGRAGRLDAHASHREVRLGRHEEVARVEVLAETREEAGRQRVQLGEGLPRHLRQVDADAAANAEAPPYLVGDGARDDVAPGEVPAGGVVLAHERQPEPIHEAGPPGERPGLHADARPVRERLDDAPRVELVELHVHQLRARVERHGEAVAGHVDRIAGDAVEPPGAAGGEDDRAGRERRGRSGGEVHGQEPADPVAVHEEREARHPLGELDAQGEDRPPQRLHERRGAVAQADAGARRPVPARSVLNEPIALLLEAGAQGLEFEEPSGRLFAERLDQPRVGEPPACSQRVLRVPLRVVVLHVPERRRVALPGHGRGAASADRPLACHADRRPRARGLERGPQAGESPADHEHVGRRPHLERPNTGGTHDVRPLSRAPLGRSRGGAASPRQRRPGRAAGGP